MSYNITAFKIRRLQNLLIPIKAIFDNPNYAQNMKLEIVNPDTMMVYWSGYGQHISGILKEGYISSKIQVMDIRISSNASAHFYQIFKDVLKQSTGKLKAIVVWEGGDKITLLTVNNGVIKEKSI